MMFPLVGLDPSEKIIKSNHIACMCSYQLVSMSGGLLGRGRGNMFQLVTHVRLIVQPRDRQDS